MTLFIKNTPSINGHIVAPGSKSHTIRAIIVASLCQGKSVLTNALQSTDTHNAIMACKQLNAIITKSHNTITITSTGLPFSISDKEIYTGNSGITTHFILPLLGLRTCADVPIILNCAAQMRARPIQSLVDALVNLGLHITYLNNNDLLPIRISGKLIGGKTTVDGMTSQYLSALLLALPCAQHNSEVRVTHLQERPYVDMTLEYLKKQKIELHHHISNNVDTFYIPGAQTYKNFSLAIPGDFSSAAYFIAAGVLIPGEIIVDGLSMADSQGDKQLVAILKKMGADIVVEKTRFIMRGGKKLQGTTIDARDIPDLLPILAVIGTYASGKTDIVNCAHARIKETDRIHAMAAGLSSMGANIFEKKDGLTIYESQLHGHYVKGYADHRTVMALSVAGLIANGTTMIDNAQAINKTFPDFVRMMQSLGANMEMTDE